MGQRSERRRSRRRNEGQEQLELALDCFESLGAWAWSEQVRGELGSDVKARRHRAVTGVERLTPRELQVALIVAEGHSNREAAARLYLSSRTIGAHLERIYRKLGVRRRGELAPLLVRQASDGLRSPGLDEHERGRGSPSEGEAAVPPT